ncbi:MAG: (Fe-S)-binding protein [Candidatus Latescibacteria bacterium]|nr:(Fe-S)-binding protein [Candidatus Latescibacterota bacterium]NIO56731.1 (Fe-S)-binding protein [Candidatus Latescibacterota bacterium]NIT02316.1 (Fe-S)-binding protein [Candidatus Latescibacterota bacterium]NIT39199.1 (Fe-S)-binding protein [Candidatus Latescibacterota bacterium]
MSRRKKVEDAITAINQGPKVLKLYMEMCARCGTCASQCPVYYAKPEKDINPVIRSDLIRAIYKKLSTTSGKLMGELVGARDFSEDDFEKWAEDFYECTGCRRCATYCPFGIDNSVITRKGRAILHELGLTPAVMQRVVDISLETGNTDGASPKAFMAAIEFLEEEMKEEHGIDIKIPVDVEGATYFYVPPSGDVLVNPEATTGIAKVFHVLGMADQWTMSSKCFDGANYGLFTGDDASMKADNKLYVDEAKRLGAKVMLMGECGHAYRIMKMMMEPAKWWGDLPFEITNCLQWTAIHIKAGRLQFDKTMNPMPVTYHDPCNFGRSCGIVDEPRIILEASCLDFREMYPNRGDNWCCGGGGGLSAMDTILDFRMEITGKKKMEQIRATGAKYVAAACSNCKRQLIQLMEYHNEDIVVGGVHDMLSRAILINGKAAQRIDYESGVAVESESG